MKGEKMPANLTMIGLYEYDPNLFEFLTFPSGIDPDVARDVILMRSGEFEVLYSDADFVHDAIRLWSSKWYRTFDKWAKALAVEYDPLENYDRREEWTDENDGVSNTTGTTSDRTQSHVDNTISAYNSSTMQPDTSSGSEGASLSSLNNTNTARNKNVRTGRAHGNIGVTTSQQMLEAELSVAEWNLYDHIADVFLNEFVIPVY